MDKSSTTKKTKVAKPPPTSSSPPSTLAKSISTVAREVQWDDKEAHALRDLFDRDGATSIAYDTLVKNIACLGLKFYPNNKIGRAHV